VAALELDRPSMAEAAERLIVNHAAIQELAIADEQSMDRLRTAAGDAALRAVPFFEQDVHDARGLAKIGEYLFEERAHAVISGRAAAPPGS
jgi:hypothetical protein